ncbi:MAG: hypothetical protein WA975_03300 [Mesorhizobium sp.]
MTKHEAPALKMQIDNGRLVPVAQWDQERIMSYRNGAVVSVRLAQEKNRKLERKYWAILHEVVDKCGVRQRTAEDLHKAIRLKLGVVDAYWTLDGKLRVDVKSTVGMEEPEYRQFFEDAMALLHKETGVDPLTLQSESADVGDEDNSQSSDASPDEGSADATTSSVGDPAADLSPADEAGTEEGDNPGQVATKQAAPSSEPIPAIKHMLMEECIENMLRDALSDQAEGKIEKLRDVFLEPQNLGDFPDFVNRCADTALRVVGKPAERDQAKEYLTGRIPA